VLAQGQESPCCGMVTLSAGASEAELALQDWCHWGEQEAELALQD